jgi:hypothetical protein
MYNLKKIIKIYLYKILLLLKHMHLLIKMKYENKISMNYLFDYNIDCKIFLIFFLLGIQN